MFCSLEFVLSFVSIPAKFEAGVWYGNSYRERILLQILPSAPKLNTLGYRDGEWTLSKSSKRVAMLGDSRFYGKYVPKVYTFSQHISRDWESLNFGLTGASIYEATDFILDDALAYQPDVIVLCYDINLACIVL